MDLSIKFFLTDLDGRQIENPRFYERALQRIILNRKLSTQMGEGEDQVCKGV